jgi:hypothetical protein
MNLSNESAVSQAIRTQGMCQTPSLYQNQTSLHQMNQQTVQQFNPYTRQTQTQIKLTFYSKTTYHAAIRTVGSAKTGSVGIVMKISAKMNNER